MAPGMLLSLCIALPQGVLWRVEPPKSIQSMSSRLVQLNICPPPSLNPHILIGKVTSTTTTAIMVFAKKGEMSELEIIPDNGGPVCPECSNHKDKRTNYYLILCSCPGTSHTRVLIHNNSRALSLSRVQGRLTCPASVTCDTH